MAERIVRRPAAENVCNVIGSLSLLAAATVIIAALGYTGTWPAYFFPFVAVAIAQILYGLLFLLRPWGWGRAGRAWSRRLAVLGMLANAALLGVLIDTRLNGLPVGPLAGRALPVTPLSLAGLAIEVLLIFGLALYLGRAPAA